MSNQASPDRSLSPTTAIVAVLAAMLCALIAAPAADAADDIFANPKCCTFAAGPFHQNLGEIPNMVIPADADIPHNAISTDDGPDGEPLFMAPTNLAGTVTPLEGAQYLEAGTYPFYCTLHGPTMGGDLVVDGSKGTVVPRPKVVAVFPAQKLKALRKRGVVRLRLRGATDVPAASVRVNLVGKGKIGEAIDVKLAAGQARVLKFRLSKKLKKAIRKRRQVKLKAAVTVKFGSPTATARKIR